MDGRPDAGRADKHFSNLGLAAIPSLRLSMVVENLWVLDQAFLVTLN